ncbi:MAG TPA: polysaccharide deacetylase family protein [Chitinophagaceae bacterium]|nr:polysaccharide deacetylase family protein [Chitinophagaceae bacterium]
MFYLVKTPFLLKKLYPECIWEIETSQKILYLTFDDGPHPEVTHFVLAELKKYNAPATFFCIGDNVKKHFEIYKKVIELGHKPANHTFHHLNGWKVNDAAYLKDISMAASVINSNLFRPPYGRISRFQLKALKGAGFNLTTIMWSLLSGDFDEKLSGENCYLNVVNNAKPGSIIVFHDSLKAFTRLKYALPRVLEYFSLKGFQFKTIGV